VGSLSFDFAAVLTAERSLDLVVIIDTLEQPPERIHDTLESLGRALDRLSSRRPITAVLIGPTPRQTAVEGLARSARVLVVGAPTGENADQTIREALAVLLPLDLPALSDSTLQSWDEMSQHLTDQHDAAIVTRLLTAAPDGIDAVHNMLRDLLTAPFVTGDDG
jgi:hypothetical protein